MERGVDCGVGAATVPQVVDNVHRLVGDKARSGESQVLVPELLGNVGVPLGLPEDEIRFERLEQREHVLDVGGRESDVSDAQVLKGQMRGLLVTETRFAVEAARDRDHDRFEVVGEDHLLHEVVVCVPGLDEMNEEDHPS